jgi:para-aminobenzoate synthetase component I
VDLERNDLGRVSNWGSVEVDELLAIEKYSHVMHLVSNVVGTLNPKFNNIDFIRAVWLESLQKTQAVFALVTKMQT